MRAPATAAQQQRRQAAPARAVRVFDYGHARRCFPGDRPASGKAHRVARVRLEAFALDISGMYAGRGLLRIITLCSAFQGLPPRCADHAAPVRSTRLAVGRRRSRAACKTCGRAARSQRRIVYRLRSSRFLAPRNGNRRRRLCHRWWPRRVWRRHRWRSWRWRGLRPLSILHNPANVCCGQAIHFDGGSNGRRGIDCTEGASGGKRSIPAVTNLYREDVAEPVRSPLGCSSGIKPNEGNAMSLADRHVGDAAFIATIGFIAAIIAGAF